MKEFIKSYMWKQFRFSLGNIPSIPIGASVLYFLLFIAHLPYALAYVLVFAFTTTINFICQILLKVVRFDRDTK